MARPTVQQHFESIRRQSDKFLATLDAFAEDGVIDADESRQIKQHLITYRAIFQSTRHEIDETTEAIRATYADRIAEAAREHGEGAREVARLRLERYHRLRPLELLKELTDRMLEVMASVPRPSYVAARDMHMAFEELASKFEADIAATPAPQDTQTVLAVNLVEVQLTDKVARWERLMEDVKRRVGNAGESPLQRVYLQGMQAAFSYILDDVRNVAGRNPPLPSRYDGLLDLNYPAEGESDDGVR